MTPSTAYLAHAGEARRANANSKTSLIAALEQKQKVMVAQDILDREADRVRRNKLTEVEIEERHHKMLLEKQDIDLRIAQQAFLQQQTALTLKLIEKLG